MKKHDRLIQGGKAVLGLIALIFTASCTAQTHSATQNVVEPVSGWIESTAIVRNAEKQADFFTRVAGYENIFSGPVSPEVLKLWKLPQTITGQEILLKEPGESRGFIRLIELSNVDGQLEARSAGTFIDTGGIMGLNLRVKDIQKTFAKLQAAGWRPLSDPVSFSVESFSVSEAIFMGPDGLVIGLIERQKPALGPEWRMPPGKLSRPNNAFVMTSNIEQAAQFYQESLGWFSFLEDKADEAAQSGMNIYGWSHNMAQSVKRHVIWMHPEQTADKREGTIALIKLDGVQGRDFSARTRPPSLGWASLRLLSDGDEAGFQEQSQPFQLYPYGCVIISVDHDFDGTQLEHLRASSGCKT